MFLYVEKEKYWTKKEKNVKSDNQVVQSSEVRESGPLPKVSGSFWSNYHRCGGRISPQRY